VVLKKGGMLEALMKAKDEGLIKHVGFSIECQNEALYRFLETDCFDVVQMQYNVLFQHPYDPFFTSGSLYDLEERKLGIVAMRTVTSGIFQKWVKLVNPNDTFNYNPALVQFVLSNKLVDVALLGMRSVERVIENIAICDDLSGRIDIDALHIRVTG
jgi:predicted aldo/keto reductase-like oxidoreductase